MVVQFVSALSIVAEIVGPSRLRKYGESMRQEFPLSIVRQRFHTAVKVEKLSWRYLWVKPKRKEEIAFLERELNSYLGKSEIGLAAGLTVLLSTATLYFFVHTMSGVWGWINGLIFAICWGITLIPFVIVPLIWVVEASLAAAIVWFIDSIIVRPFSSLLEHPQLGQRVKILSVVLLAIGFHFDLLAS